MQRKHYHCYVHISIVCVRVCYFPQNVCTFWTRWPRFYCRMLSVNFAYHKFVKLVLRTHSQCINTSQMGLIDHIFSVSTCKKHLLKPSGKSSTKIKSSNLQRRKMHYLKVLYRYGVRPLLPHFSQFLLHPFNKLDMDF